MKAITYSPPEIYSKVKGIIYHTNVSRGMYSAKLTDGSFTVFELVDPIELNRYAEVMGDLEARGEREILLNEEDQLHVHIDGYGLTEIVAFTRTFLIT
jgi:hypothetical protein